MGSCIDEEIFCPSEEYKTDGIHAWAHACEYDVSESTMCEATEGAHSYEVSVIDEEVFHVWVI